MPPSSEGPADSAGTPSETRQQLWSAGVPFAVSLILSLSTVGSSCGWQDSGYFLVGIRDLSVLYPHGHVLYQLSCWVWTKMLGFLDFTLAVHLFSTFCAALAAAGLGAATRALIRTREGPLRLFDGPAPDPGPALAGAVAGSLAAAGYTFWAAALMAKGYALLYLVLAALIWRIIVAADRRRPADFTGVAALIGLSWAAHPSATLAGAAFAAFATWSVRTIGWKGLAWRLGLAAVCAAGPGALALPLLARREMATAMGDPGSGEGLLRFFIGAQYTGQQHVFGLNGVRAATLGQYVWEEFLAVGLLLAGAGIYRAVLLNRKAVLWALAWTGPYAGGAILFVIEGQHDHWLVAAWMPFYVFVGLGAYDLIRRSEKRGAAAAAAAALVGLVWAFAANRPLLNQRGYDLAERYARNFFKNMEPRAIFLSVADDASGGCTYLQRIRGQRPDVLVVNSVQLGGRDLWYDRLLRRQEPRLGEPDYASMIARYPERLGQPRVAAFIAANKEIDRPVYSQVWLPPEMMPAGWELLPAGPFCKLVRAGGAPPDPRSWDLPDDPSEIRAQFRRERGIVLARSVNGIDVYFEPYERRLLSQVLSARQFLAEWQVRRGAIEPAVKLFESIMAADPLWRRRSAAVQLLGFGYLAQGRHPEAERCFRTAIEYAGMPWTRAGSLLALGDIERKKGNPEGARQYYREAAAVPGLTDAQANEIAGRLRN